MVWRHRTLRPTAPTREVAVLAQAGRSRRTNLGPGGPRHAKPGKLRRRGEAHPVRHRHHCVDPGMDTSSAGVKRRGCETRDLAGSAAHGLERPCRLGRGGPKAALEGTVGSGLRRRPGFPGSSRAQPSARTPTAIFRYLPGALCRCAPAFGSHHTVVWLRCWLGSSGAPRRARHQRCGRSKITWRRHTERLSRRAQAQFSLLRAFVLSGRLRGRQMAQ